MTRYVSIDPKCLTTSLIPSVIEIYNRETSGYLIGSNGGSRLKVISAYHIQTDKKKPTFVEHGNYSAIDRVEGFIKTLNLNLIGGFHSHPMGPNKLSKSDVRFISEKAEEHNLGKWLELILSVRKREYATEHRPCWKIKRYERKLGFTVKTDPCTGYDITISGFWLKRNGAGLKVAGEAVLYAGRNA